MSTTTNQNMRSVSELEKCNSYSEMTDAEIDYLMSYKINLALTSQEAITKINAVKAASNEIIEQNRAACERSAKALEYMCGQVFTAAPPEITKLDFHPMEFSNE